MNIKELAFLIARTDAAMVRQGVSVAARTEVLETITSTATVDFERSPNTRICDTGTGASGEATVSECDDSPQIAAAERCTAGPAATSSQGDSYTCAHACFRGKCWSSDCIYHPKFAMSAANSATPAPTLPRESGAGFLTMRQAG